VPATPQIPRWFVDENSLGVAKALAYVRGDVTWPGAPGGPVPAGAPDTAWLPVIGQAGLVVLTRDKRIRSRPLERQALLD
jgi:PIN like domain